MCGAAGSLFMLWVRSGFSTASVASALTFFPPHPPTYALELEQNELLASVGCGDKWSLQEYKVKHLILENRCDEKFAQVYKVTTRHGNEIPCFVFKQPNAKFTMIFSHGNATDCGAMYSRYMYLSKELNVNIAAYDYSGYGAASGEPSEANTYSDIEAVYDFAVSNFCPLPEKSLLVYGQSVGSGPSIYIASKKTIAGLIIHSGILSGMRVLTTSRVLGCLDIYPNANRIHKVNCMTFIIHGQEDEEVGINHGTSLYEALPKKFRYTPYWVANRGHNDIGETYQCRMEYTLRLKDFVQSLN